MHLFNICQHFLNNCIFLLIRDIYDNAQSKYEIIQEAFKQQSVNACKRTTMNEIESESKTKVNDDYDNHWADNLIPIVTIGFIIYYTLQNRQFEEYKYIALTLGGLSSAYVAVSFYQNGGYKNTAKLFGTSLFLLLLAPFTGMIYYSISVCLYDAAIYLYKISNQYWKVLLPASFSLLIGYLLFLFREKNRILFGFSEIMVGVMAGVLHGQVVFTDQSELDKPNFYFVVLSASIYLIVRGFDNMSIGLKKKNENN